MFFSFILIIVFVRDVERISNIEKLIVTHKFNILFWELENLPKKIFNFTDTSNLTEEEVRKEILEEGISPDDLEGFFQKELSTRIKETLSMKFLFPPLSFSIEKPPKVLVISPRDKIFQQRAILLNNQIPEEEIILIENSIDSMDLSSLILDTGGFAAYPSIIKPSKNYDFLLSTIAHEWLHHYLIFSPLGRSYFKGGDMISINETLADLFAKEIMGRSDNRKSTHNKFKIMMRETRLNVDQLLADGRVDEAEVYMNQRKNFINNEGYKIRKINQAYFAFHGNYGDSPSSVNDYNKQLEYLLSTYETFEDFLNEIKNIDEPEQLENLIKIRSY